jgi:hypothetical protein
MGGTLRVGFPATGFVVGVGRFRALRFDTLPLLDGRAADVSVCGSGSWAETALAAGSAEFSFAAEISVRRLRVGVPRGELVLSDFIGSIELENLHVLESIG